MLRLIKVSEKWSWAGPHRWRKAFDGTKIGINDPTLQGLDDEIRRLFPRPGKLVHGAQPVFLAPGGSIKIHAHKEWTALFYVDAAGTPVVIEGLAILPDAGTALLLAPGVNHYVNHPKTADRDRFTIAWRWMETWAE